MCTWWRHLAGAPPPFGPPFINSFISYRLGYNSFNWINLFVSGSLIAWIELGLRLDSESSFDLNVIQSQSSRSDLNPIGLNFKCSTVSIQFRSDFNPLPIQFTFNPNQVQSSPIKSNSFATRIQSRQIKSQSRYDSSPALIDDVTSAQLNSWSQSAGLNLLKEANNKWQSKRESYGRCWLGSELGVVKLSTMTSHTNTHTHTSRLHS